MSRDLFVVSINVSHADQAAHRASGRAGGSARHVASAPAGPASHTGSRRGEPTWAVILRGQRYDVTDEGKGTVLCRIEELCVKANDGLALILEQSPGTGREILQARPHREH